MTPLNGGYFTDRILTWLRAWGYRQIEIPTLMPAIMFRACTAGTENRMFDIDDNTVLTPEVTNYIKAAGIQRLGTDKVVYVARCFRNETTTDAERLREFTQIGVEYLGPNPLDFCKVVRKDAIKIFQKLLKDGDWKLDDNVERGLNLYLSDGKTFEVTSPKLRKQMLGGGTYEGGAGWALGLERVLAASR